MEFVEAWTDTCSSVGLAARNGDLATLKELIQRGQPLDVEDNRGWRPIHEAASKNHVECLRELINQDIDFNACTHEGCTALLLACSRGHEDTVLLLLEHGASADVSAPCESTPLISAINSGCLKCVQLLLAKQIRVNETDWNGWTALHEATKSGNLTVMSLLLERGADVLKLDDNCMTAFFVAAEHGKCEALKLLLQHVNNEDPLNLVNTTAIDGASPLMISAQGGHLDCVSFLLEHGADVHCSVVDGVTAAHLAAYKGHLTVLELLVDRITVKALESPPPEGLLEKCSILHLAADIERCAVIELLLKKGFNMELEMPTDISWSGELDEVAGFRFPERFTPLGLASKVGSVRGMEVLLKAGANPNALSEHVMAPLTAAVLNNDPKAARVLLENGAEVNYCGSGPHPAAVAIGIFSVCLVELLKAGANIDFLVEREDLQPFQSLIAINTNNPAGDEEFLRVGILLHDYMGRSDWNKLSSHFMKYFQRRLPDALKRLQEVGATISSLQHLCRLVIRKRIISINPKSVLKVVPGLPVPKCLQEYLVYNFAAEKIA